MSDGTQCYLPYRHGDRLSSTGAWSSRLSEEARVAVQAWAEKQPDKPSLSEAIERLVETGVSD